MKRLWLILDVSYLGWRAFHTTGGLSHRGSSTGVVFGLLRDIKNLQTRFDCDSLAFCFDSRTSIRSDLLPTYKEDRKKSREKLSEEKQKRILGLKQQITKMRTDYLPEIGFKNIFHQVGYESDDIIGSLCFHRPWASEFIIVSADTDLFQLISPWVSCYNPKTKVLLTMKKFIEQYGITPRWWTEVKAIAGCHTDCIPGIKGVGETTALQYIRDELKESSPKLSAILAGQEIIKRNRRLVRLPFPGTQKFKLTNDNISEAGWRNVTSRLGIRSL